MSGLRTAWESFWFDKEDPSALAVVRIAFYGFLALTSWKFWGTPRPWADVPAEFWDPIGLFALLPRPNAAWIGVLWPVWHIALGLACVGLFTRAATIVSFLVGLYLVGVSGMFGVLSHTNHVEIPDRSDDERLCVLLHGPDVRAVDLLEPADLGAMAPRGGGGPRQCRFPGQVG